MKALITAALVLMGTSSAMACWTGRSGMTICAGDRVAHISAPNAGMATVTGTNPATGLVSIEFDNAVGVHTYSPSDLTFAKQACLKKNLCVGSRIVHMDSPNAGIATVVALNKLTQKVSVEFDNAVGIHTYDPGVFSLTKGCTQGICVGDRGAHIGAPNAGMATIVGVNRTDRKVTVEFDNAVGLHTYDADQLTIQELCLEYSNEERGGDIPARTGNF